MTSAKSCCSPCTAYTTQVDRDGTVIGEASGDESSSDEDDDEDMDEDMGAGPSTAGQQHAARERQEPVVDADGFTMVQKGRKGRR